MKQMYYVTMKIDARYVAAVLAESVEEAKEKAMGRYQDADFGEAEDIDGEIITVENEEGDYVFEK